MWNEEFDRIDDAYHFEKMIQGWGRKKREALIRGDYDALPALSRRKAVQDREAAAGQSLVEVRDEGAPRSPRT